MAKNITQIGKPVVLRLVPGQSVRIDGDCGAESIEVTCYRLKNGWYLSTRKVKGEN